MQSPRRDTAGRMRLHRVGTRKRREEAGKQKTLRYSAYVYPKRIAQGAESTACVVGGPPRPLRRGEPDLRIKRRHQRTKSASSLSGRSGKLPLLSQKGEGSCGGRDADKLGKPSARRKTGGHARNEEEGTSPTVKRKDRVSSR